MDPRSVFEIHSNFRKSEQVLLLLSNIYKFIISRTEKFYKTVGDNRDNELSIAAAKRQRLCKAGKLLSPNAMKWSSVIELGISYPLT